MRHLLAAAGLAGALAATLTSCFAPFACTEIGCEGTLTLTFTAPEGPLELYAGTVTVGDRVYDIDCTGAAEPVAEYTCGVGELSIRLEGEGEADTEVDWQLHAWKTSDPDASVPPYISEDGATPEWSEWEPNGKGCPPTCRSAEVTVHMGVLD